MSIGLTGSVGSRPNLVTAEIDRLSTQDMLGIIHYHDSCILEAVTPWLVQIAGLVDNAQSTLSHGGRLIIIGAGASGRAGVLAADGYAPGEPRQVIGMIAGGSLAMLHEMDNAAKDDERGALDLQVIGFNDKDMLLGLSVSGKPPWTWGRYTMPVNLGRRWRL